MATHSEEHAANRDEHTITEGLAPNIKSTKERLGIYV